MKCVSCFVRQKAEDELGISDGSSDVCSSDLWPHPIAHLDPRQTPGRIEKVGRLEGLPAWHQTAVAHMVRLNVRAPASQPRCLGHTDGQSCEPGHADCR